MKKITQLLLVLSGIFLFISIFVPIWRIDLDAPQYPEGLQLLIYSNKLGGAVDIINGLNHYIGMRTLHADDFVEFTVLPYIIGFYALFSILTALLKSKKLLSILFFAFVAFGIIAMIDFWRWEYDYGHNLDPNAAIIVPGMAYQPPLIGFKQLLNFGAYSIPDIGGILFIISGLFMLLGLWLERKNKTPMKKSISIFLLIVGFSSLSACVNDQPIAINYNNDGCDYCKMTIVDSKFACEIKTKKGKVFKFDDLSCLTSYIEDKKLDASAINNYYVCDFSGKNNLSDAKKMFFIKSENINSPMGGDIAAFTNNDSAKNYISYYKAETISWNDLIPE